MGWCVITVALLAALPADAVGPHTMHANEHEKNIVNAFDQLAEITISPHMKFADIKRFEIISN